MISCLLLLFISFLIPIFLKRQDGLSITKKIPYKIVNLVPGLHLLTTKRLAPKTTVPIIVHNGKVIQDSTIIFDYLDETFPQKQLTPKNQELKKEALELEEWLDDLVGDNIRRMMYYHLLPDKKLSLSLLLKNSP